MSHNYMPLDFPTNKIHGIHLHDFKLTILISKKSHFFAHSCMVSSATNINNF